MVRLGATTLNSGAGGSQACGSLRCRAFQQVQGGAERRTGVERFAIPDEIARDLERLAREERATLFSVVLAVFYLWLHREIGQADLAVGSLFANRLRPETRATVGFFANLLVLRTEVPSGGTFRDLLRTTRTTVIEALAHQEVPFPLVRRDVAADGPARPENLMFQLMPAPISGPSPFGGLDAEQLGPPDGLATRFDLEFVLAPASGGGLGGLAMFACDRFDRGWVRRSAAEFAALAAAVTGSPDLRLSAFEGTVSDRSQ